MKKMLVTAAVLLFLLGATGCAFWEKITYKEYFSETSVPLSDESYADMVRNAVNRDEYIAIDLAHGGPPTTGRIRMYSYNTPAYGVRHFEGMSLLYSTGHGYIYIGGDRPHFSGYWPYRRRIPPRPYKMPYEHRSSKYRRK